MCYLCIFMAQLHSFFLKDIVAYFFSEDDLVELCRQYGDVEQAHIVVDKTTKLSTGRGYVLFSLPDSAVRYRFIISMFNCEL